jgi:predicted NAD/FAD-dependent oxidoreductase
MRIGIIGAGMAGLSCAQALRDQGHHPVLFDKGRGPGGRMSTRRIDTPLDEAAFDHGAQYLTARDPAFVAQVDRWAQAGHGALVACGARCLGRDAGDECAGPRDGGRPGCSMEHGDRQRLA